MKRIEHDGKFYRKRRGKLVEIPAKWVGKVPDITNRQSKRTESRSRRIAEDDTSSSLKYKRLRLNERAESRASGKGA